MDFTLKKYKALIRALHNGGYKFVTMSELIEAQKQNWPMRQALCCMRHDVDLRANQSLRVARIEHDMGIKATYYFRVTKGSNVPSIIRQIAALGHEIGYHYEDMAICHGDTEKAYEHFKTNLEYFRTYYPVKTICMHGAPTSQFDGRDLWKSHDYKELGIICEPYLDLDYSRILYLTDTGRRWDGYKVSVRDKIPVYQDKWARHGLSFHTTDDLINYVEVPRAIGMNDEPDFTLPKHLLLTTHPQRWTNDAVKWTREIALQSAKNIVKRLIVRIKK